MTACPENSTASEGACICSSGFTPSGDRCAASSSTNLSTGAIAGISVVVIVTCSVPLTGYLPLHNEQSERSQRCQQSALQWARSRRSVMGMPRLTVPLINANQLAMLRYVQTVERALSPSTASAQQLVVPQVNVQTLLTIMQLLKSVGSALDRPSCTRAGATWLV